MKLKKKKATLELSCQKDVDFHVNRISLEFEVDDAHVAQVLLADDQAAFFSDFPTLQKQKCNRLEKEAQYRSISLLSILQNLFYTSLDIAHTMLRRQCHLVIFLQGICDFISK